MTFGLLSCNGTELQSVTSSYESLHANSSGATQDAKIYVNNPNATAVDFYIKKNGGSVEKVVSVPAKTDYLLWDAPIPNGWQLDGKTGSAVNVVVWGKYTQLS